MPFLAHCYVFWPSSLLYSYSLSYHSIRPYCNVQNTIKWWTINPEKFSEHHSISPLTYTQNDDATTTITQSNGDGVVATIAQVGSSAKMFFFHVVNINFVVVVFPD